jgi:group I intron endonuclease
MYIYKTTNRKNGKIYVGMSKYNPEDNPKYLGSGYILKKAINKYGVENFEKEILEECKTDEELRAQEKFWIKFLNAQHRDVGYNISEGGDWGDTFTFHPDKEKIREKYKERVGEKNPNYGKKWSEEKRKIASEQSKREKRHIDKKTGLNKAQTSQARKKIREGKLGIKNPNACIWELISPEGDVHTIEGGIKRKLKNFGLDYQQFERYSDVRKSRDGWILTKKDKPK